MNLHYISYHININRKPIVVSITRKTNTAWYHLYVESKKKVKLIKKGRKVAARGWGWRK